MNIGVPNKINSVVKEFAANICPGELQYVRINAEPYSKNNWCFQNVEEKVRRDGGEVVYGWSFLWWEQNFIEAEFHAIWKSPEGELIDITPIDKGIQSDRILFLEDPIKKYDGLRTDVIRKSLTDNTIVNDYIKLSKAMFDVVKKVQQPHELTLRLHDDDAIIYNQIQRLIAVIMLMVKKRGNANSLCACGSKNRYKHCCGKEIRKILKKYN